MSTHRRECWGSELKSCLRQSCSPWAAQVMCDVNRGICYSNGFQLVFHRPLGIQVLPLRGLQEKTEIWKLRINTLKPSSLSGLWTRKGWRVLTSLQSLTYSLARDGFVESNAFNQGKFRLFCFWLLFVPKHFGQPEFVWKPCFIFLLL